MEEGVLFHGSPLLSFLVFLYFFLCNLAAHFHYFGTDPPGIAHWPVRP